MLYFEPECASTGIRGSCRLQFDTRQRLTGLGFCIQAAQGLGA